jgi:ATP-dependent DNA helicase RecG
MTSALDKLSKMIALEIEQGYQNKAVIGGLDRVLAWWPLQTRSECTLPKQEVIITEVIGLINGYGALSGKDAREQSIAEIQKRLELLEDGEEAPASPQAVPNSPGPVARTLSSNARVVAGDETGENARLGLNSPTT